MSAFWLGGAKLGAACNADRAKKNIHFGTQLESDPGSTTWASHFVSVSLSELIIFFPENTGIIMPTE